MSRPCIHTAWDNAGHEGPLFRGLEKLRLHGVKPDHITVYMLIGYDHKTRQPIENVTASDLYRQDLLRDFGCRPYPMPYVRTRELEGFQRWVVGAYDKRFSWDDWKRAQYRPERLG